MSNEVLFNLNKDEPVFDLSKEAPNLLEEVIVGCSWKTKNNVNVDIDVSAVAYNEDGSKLGHAYYGNCNQWLLNGSIYHKGDDLTGSDAKSDVDNEQIIIKLSKVPSGVKSIYLMGNVYDRNKDEVKSWNMCLRDASGVKVLNADVGRAGVKGVVFAVLIRDGAGAWTFEHVNVEVNAGGYKATMAFIDAKNLKVRGSVIKASIAPVADETPKKGFLSRLMGRG